MLISIAILTHNRERQVLRAINSVKNQIVTEGNAIEVVVVDNASTDNTIKNLQVQHPDVKILKTHRNLGCPAGRNILYANCAGDVIVNLDDDGELAEGVVQGAVDIFLSDPSIWVVGFKQVVNSSSHTQDGQSIIETSSFSGGLSAFRKVIFDRVGFYPDDYFFLAEEEHLALRIINAGGRIVYCPHLVMFHPVGQSPGERWDYYRYRNALFNVVELFPTLLRIPYFILRAGSYSTQSVRRGSFSLAFRAILVALAAFATRPRTPVSVETIRKYQQLRSLKIN